MSYKTTESIVCPTCGAVHKGPVWSVVTASENKGIKGKIINGDFFTRTCKTCGETFSLYHPVLYDDDVNNALIYHVNSIHGISDANSAIRARRSESVCDDYQIRIAPNSNILREKARIFDMGLDDRIVEIAKIVMLEKIAAKNLAGKVKDVLCWINEDKSLELAFFGEKTGTVTVNRALYDHIDSKCRRLIEEKYKDVTEVDLDWAIEFLDENDFVLD